MDADPVERLVASFVAKDLEAALALFADDALLIDPHYPVARMQGKAAIRQGLAWAFDAIERPGFTARRRWFNGESGALEVDTHHVLKGGMRLNIPQVFVVETRDGQFVRLQAYTPYPPPGIGGLVAKLTRLIWRLQGKIA